MSELHDAVIKEDLDLVEKLLSDGVDPNQLDDDGNTPLDLTHNNDIIDLLFGYGAFRDPDYYFDMRYHAFNHIVSSFDIGFKTEILEKLKANYQMDLSTITKKDIISAESGVLFDLKVIGIRSILNGQIEFSDDYGSVGDINTILERLNYIVEIEGPKPPSKGSISVYFVK